PAPPVPPVCPQPGTESVQLEVGPLFRAMTAVRQVARVQLAATYDVALFIQLAVQHADAPVVEGTAALRVTDEVHGVGDERSVSEPGVAIGRERWRGQVCALGRLPGEDHLDAVAHEALPSCLRDRADRC